MVLDTVTQPPIDMSSNFSTNTGFLNYYSCSYAYKEVKEVETTSEHVSAEEWMGIYEQHRFQAHSKTGS